MTFTLTSSAFSPGQSIPRRHTCDGENLSPPLAWQDAPAGAQAFALVMDDPDAPGGTFTHWMLADIPPDRSDLPEGLASGRIATAGRNDFGRPGYSGPCPPRGHGSHRYRVHLYALRERLGLAARFSRAAIDAALDTRVLAAATLEGRYERR